MYIYMNAHTHMHNLYIYINSYLIMASRYSHGVTHTYESTINMLLSLLEVPAREIKQ